MRTPRALSAALAAALLGVAALSACGGGDDSLSEEEQRYADAFARDLANDDDGLGLETTDAQCVGEAILHELGTDPFKEAKVEPADLAGDDTPGELLGSGTVSDEAAAAIADEWNDCVDMAEVFARQAGAQFSLNDKGLECFKDELSDSDVLDEYLELSFTSDDAGDARDVLNRIVALVQQCSANGGSGGVLVDSIAASLAEGGKLTPEQARCVAQQVVDEVGADKLVGIGSGETLSEAPQDVQQEFAAAIVGATETCGLDISQLG